MSNWPQPSAPVLAVVLSASQPSSIMKSQKMISAPVTEWRKLAFRLTFPVAILAVGIWSSITQPVDRCGWLGSQAVPTSLDRFAGD
jgi:hypothetical protein